MIEDLPAVEFAFPGALRDQLLAAITAGTKWSTSSLLAEYRVSETPLPQVGDRGCVVDSEGRAAFVIEIVSVALVPLADVPLDHVVGEGEGFRSVGDWRAAHDVFWSGAEIRAAVGDDFHLDDESIVVLERFRVLSQPRPEPNPWK